MWTVSAGQHCGREATVADGSTGDTLRTGWWGGEDVSGGAGYSTLNRFYWNQFGWAAKGAALTNNTNWAQGRFNMFPQGLGYLLTGNYMPDAQGLFCPSTTVINRYVISAAAYSSPADLKEVGGTDARSWTYGDYTDAGAKRTITVTGGTARTWFGAYNYRMTPLLFYTGADGYNGRDCRVPGEAAFIPKTTGSPHTGAYSNCNCMWFGVPYCAPYQSAQNPFKVRNGMPCFKSQKQLAQRTLISDGWGRHWSVNTITGSSADLPRGKNSVTGQIGAQAAQGWWAHRDGYNALYGDGHAAWLGDPQQKIIWWPTNVGNYGWTNGDGFAITWVAGPSYGGGTSGYAPCNSLMVWHYFDAANGLDRSFEGDPHFAY
jgi:prepilin-type processing-associated H-X9-DG protein